jgi:hypothetical protein
MRPSTGPAHGAHRKPVATRARSRQHARALGSRAGLSRLGQTRPKNHKSLGEPIGERRKQERAKKRRSRAAISPPYWFASTAHPPATAARVATNANVTATPQHRQSASNERTVHSRTHKRQHRQDSRADDGQHIAEIGQQKKNHVLFPVQAVIGLNVRAAPLMQ